MVFGFGGGIKRRSARDISEIAGGDKRAERFLTEQDRIDVQLDKLARKIDKCNDRNGDCRALQTKFNSLSRKQDRL